MTPSKTDWNTMPDLAEDTSDREIVMTRTFEAPRELVYEAFTEPEHIIHWWGPNGFTNTTHEMTVAPGGVWRYIMHGPDGTDYPDKISYIVVKPPERLEYAHGADDENPPHFHVVVTFDANGSQTEFRMRLIFPNAEACDATKKFGAVEGGNQTLARLAEYLKTMA